MSIELLKLENAIEEYRKLQIAGKYATELQPQAMCALLMIARGHFQAEEARDEKAKYNCYVTVTEIQDKLRLSSASASRNVGSLTVRGGRPVTIKGVVQRDDEGDPIWGDEKNPNGLGLVDYGLNKRQGNKKILYLTDKGIDFVRQIQRIMKTDNPNLLEDRRTIRSTVTDARTTMARDGTPLRESKRERIKMANAARAQGASLTEVNQILGGDIYLDEKTDKIKPI